MADSIVVPALDAGQSCTFYVYLISRPDGTPCYVGKGHGRRMHAHFAGRKFKNVHLARIVAKAGGKLPVRKIAEGMPESEAFELEKFLIQEIGREAYGGPLINLQDGGEGAVGLKMTSASRARITAALKKRWAENPNWREQSEESKTAQSEKMRKWHEENPEFGVSVSQRMSGKPAHNKGKSPSAETRQKLSESLLGRPGPNKGKTLSPEWIENLRLSHLGQVRTPEASEKCAAKLRGKPRPPHIQKMLAEFADKSRGVPKSAEVRRNMSIGSTGKVLSEEHKRNLGIASKKAWAKRRTDKQK